MLTSQQRQSYQQADAELDRQTEQRVSDLLSMLSVSNPVEYRAGVLDTMPALVAELSDVSSVIAADMYETAREQSEARGRFVVDLSEPPTVEQVEASSRWALAPVFQAESALSFAEIATLVSVRLEASAARLVRSGGRSTIVDNAARDPGKPRYGRVLSGKKTHCDFCRMLAGRGFVYHTEDSSGVGKDWHDRCGCALALGWNP